MFLTDLILCIVEVFFILLPLMAGIVLTEYGRDFLYKRSRKFREAYDSFMENLPEWDD